MQGSMIVREYSLKFVKLSRHTTLFVSNSRDEMSRFLSRISEDLEEECWSTMLHDSMNLSRLMVHVQLRTTRWKGESVREGDLSLLTKKVPALVVAGALSRFVISPNLRKFIRDKGTLTLRGMQHPDNALLSLIRSMEVICSVPKKNVASVVVFTVGSED